MSTHSATRQDSLSSTRVNMAFVDSASCTPDAQMVQENVTAELRSACESLEVTLLVVPFKKLDFGEANALDLFYNADVAVIDLTDRRLHLTLRYRIGVRQSCGMTSNIALFCANGYTKDEIIAMKNLWSASGCSFFAYSADSKGAITAVDAISTFLPLADLTSDTAAGCYGGAGSAPVCDSACSGGCSMSHMRLRSRIKKALFDVEKSAKRNRGNKIIADIRKARKEHKDDMVALKKAIYTMKNRIDDIRQCSPDVVSSMLLAYRDIQDYDAMVKFVDMLESCGEMMPESRVEDVADIQYQHAFALNRRNKPGDRAKALAVIKRVADKMGSNLVPDFACLCGRIYKDTFLDSDCIDSDAQSQAIYWYRKAFEIQPSLYAGINLATMLVISGRQFSIDPELQKIGVELNSQLGIKGQLQSLQDYWDVATYYEVCVLAEEYGKANEAADCMFKLRPPLWNLQTTLGNIELIKRFRNLTPEDETNQEMQVFNFWMDFFKEAVSESLTSAVRFPVLVLEPTCVYTPSHVQINIADEPASVRLWQVETSDHQTCHSRLFTSQSIKKVSPYKRDSSAVLLYVTENSDTFHIYFPSALQSAQFYRMVVEMLVRANEGSQNSSYAGSESSDFQIKYAYDYEENGNRVLLGRGSLGVVVAAHEVNTQKEIAIKEIKESLLDVQLLYEEIQLHSRLSHKNVVGYLGSMCDNGCFKIFMERVPGGSLMHLLRSKWGRLAEVTTSFYTRQILDGLHYLHQHQIVHRDLKSSNVLVNTFSGLVKISDFGTSKRSLQQAYTGLGQHLAPEVITSRGFVDPRRYGHQADVWALGCIVVEMATGGPQPTATTAGNIAPHSAIIKVGKFAHHPSVPQILSSSGKEFLLRCFEPDPAKRATADDLLKMSFVHRSRGLARRNRHQPVSPETGRNGDDLRRSDSAPAYMSSSTPASMPDLSLNACGPSSAASGSASTCTAAAAASGPPPPERALRLHVPTLLAPGPSCGPSSANSEVSTDTAVMPLRRDGRPMLSRSRRLSVSPAAEIHYGLANGLGSSTGLGSGGGCLGSNGGLGSSGSTFAYSNYSWEWDSSSAAGGGSQSTSALRHDLQARSDLAHSLESGAERLVCSWRAAIVNDASATGGEASTRLTQERLRGLLTAVCEFMRTGSRACVEKALDDLNKEVDLSDAAVRKELTAAAYHFNDEARYLIRQHTIQPHHVFALDDCLSSATQALLDATLLYGRRSSGDDSSIVMATDACPASPQSLSSPHLLLSPSLAPGSSLRQLLIADYCALRTESIRMQQELMELEREWQQIAAVAAAGRSGKLRPEAFGRERLVNGRGCALPPPCPEAAPDVSVSNGTASPADQMPDDGSLLLADHGPLVRWLRSEAEADDDTVLYLVREKYMLSDILSCLTFDDIRRMPLRGGQRCRLWRAISKHREAASASPPPSSRHQLPGLVVEMMP